MNYNDPENMPAVWQVGDVILDRYEVKQVFTGGGMGLVYRVHHRDWAMDLAVKSPRPEFFQTQQPIENFEREAETWVNLGLHPHIGISGDSRCDVERLVRLRRAVKPLANTFTDKARALRRIETVFQTMLHRTFTGELTARWREAPMRDLLAEMERQAKALGHSTTAAYV